MKDEAAATFKEGIVVTAPEQARAARVRRTRHRVLVWSFVALVLLPTALAAFYLWRVAADQYHSDAAFAVRSEEFANPLEALGAFTQVGTSSASDSQVIFDYIRSQPLIVRIDEQFDLRSVFQGDEADVLFGLQPDASMEDLVDYWQRMVTVAFDPSSGVLTLEVRAFSAEDAQRIAGAIIAESGLLVDDLSRVARQDAMRFASEDVATAEDRLRDLRRAVREFRAENDLIDPTAIATSQMGLIGILQTQLAEALVSRDTLIGFAGNEDQRVRNLDLRIEAIRNQIDEERRRIGESAGQPASLADAIGQYEELLVDMEFAENAYQSALAAAEQARAEARRKSRYLGIHIPPTLAQESRYPQRGLLLVFAFLCAAALWVTSVLVYYNIREKA